MEETQQANQIGRDALNAWEAEIKKNVYAHDEDYQHTIKFYLAENFSKFNAELTSFGEIVPTELERLVRENNLPANLPRLETYSPTGERIDRVVHNPVYVEAGNLIYKTGLMGKMAKPGGLMECLSLLFLSAQTGEAGHNCPVACSAGIIRVLQRTSTDFPEKNNYLNKLTAGSFDSNFTGAQFLTEIQGGSDVGLNAVYAKQDEKKAWRIHGEKWFCSNAGADLIFLTARYDQSVPGTKGLGLFLVPREWQGQKNLYSIRRFKDKIGTRSMATGEIDFHGAYAFSIGPLEEGIHLVMDNVLHLSRLFNATCMLGMARRAQSIATAYARHRIVFSQPIINYPLVKENLARIKAENTAMLAASFATIRMQDQFDMGINKNEETGLLLRSLVNMQKYLSALWSVEHVHHSLDMLAGNGTIEIFSPLPRLLRDGIVCENWEGTHNVLRMQLLKDILKYNVDEIFLGYMRKELSQFKQFSLHTQEISAGLSKLEKELAAFRQLDGALQALQIRLIVDRMVILFCALTLLIEALDQQKSTKSASKLDCYYYFCMLHLEENKISYDQNYLELITRLAT